MQKPLSKLNKSLVHHTIIENINSAPPIPTACSRTDALFLPQFVMNQALSLLANAATSVAPATITDNIMVDSSGQPLSPMDEVKVESKVEGSAVSESGSTESKTESEGLLTIDETTQAQQEQEGSTHR